MPRRSADDITRAVIDTLDKGEQSINEIARAIRANWSTVRRALALLKDLKIVEETVTTHKIRLFRLKKRKPSE